MTSSTPGTKLLTEQRRRKVCEMVQSMGVVTIDELVNELNVSPMTVWRDLIVLEQEGKVRRVRGGVSRIEPESTGEPLYRSKRIVQKEKKTIIARYAARHFVADNDIIILEAGTTAGAMIEFLRYRRLTAITNGLGNLDELAQAVPDVTVLSCGGMLRDVALTFVGPQAEEFFRNVRAHTFFLGATGLALPEGITDPNPLEVQIKRAMVASASRVVLLLDSTKFGVRSLTPIVPLDRLEAIVTDSGAPPEYVEALRGMGIAVHIAS